MDATSDGHTVTCQTSTAKAQRNDEAQKEEDTNNILAQKLDGAKQLQRALCPELVLGDCHAHAGLSPVAVPARQTIAPRGDLCVLYRREGILSPHSLRALQHRLCIERPHVNFRHPGAIMGWNDISMGDILRQRWRVWEGYHPYSLLLIEFVSACRFSRGSISIPTGSSHALARAQKEPKRVGLSWSCLASCSSSSSPSSPSICSAETSALTLSPGYAPKD